MKLIRRRTGGVVGAVVTTALVAAAAASAAGGGPPVIKLKSLHVPGVGKTELPLAEVASPNGKTLYVAGEGQGVIAVNLAHPTAKPKVITDSGAPLTQTSGLAISPNGKTLYALVEETGTTTSYEILAADVGGSGAKNNTVVNTVKDPHKYLSDVTGIGVAGMAISPNGKTLYVSTVTETTGATPEPLGQVAMATLSGTGGTVNKRYAPSDDGLGYPFGIALNPKGNRLYLSNLLGEAHAVSVSGEKLSSLHGIPEALSTVGFKVSADARTLYASVSNFLVIESASENTTSEIQTFELGDDGFGASLKQASVLPKHSLAFGLTTNPSGSRGYIGLFTITESGGSEQTSGSLDSFTIPPAASSVTIAGSATSGATVTAKVKGIAGGSDTYKWLASGKAIKGATSSKLKLGGAEAGKKLTVEVTETAVGYSKKTVTSKAVSVK